MLFKKMALTGIAVAAMTTGAAFAQTSQSTTERQLNQSTAPANQMQSSTTGAAATTQIDQTVATLKVDSFNDMNIIGQDGKSIGEVEKTVKKGNQIFAIADLGGFLGIGSKRVLIPVTEFRLQDDALLLQGVTKAAIESLPAYDDSTEDYAELDDNTTLRDAVNAAGSSSAPAIGTQRQ